MAEKVHDRLDSWKAIAEYLDRDPTTVMRWAKERGLPVYVVPGEGQRHRAVYAYKTEIDAWLGKLSDHGTPARQNDRHNRVAHAEKDRPEGPSEKAAPQSPEMSLDAGETPVPRHAGEWAPPQGGGLSPVVVPNALRPSPSSRRGTGRTLWAVCLAGTILVAVAAAAWLRVPPPEPKVLRFEQLTNDGFEKRLGLVTDGARVYFIENSRDGYVVAGIPGIGGNPVAIARANRDSAVQDISPDRTELLLIQEARFRPGSVWILPLLAGSARRLGTVQAFSAAWSPDGALLAYTTDDGLYLCDSDGANSRRIVAMSGRLDNVRWSPDGRELSLRRYSSKEVTLWKVDRDGRGLYPLCPGWEIPREGTPCFWTPDSKYLIVPGSYAGHEAPWALRVSIGLLKRHEQATCLSAAGLNLRPETMSPDGSRLYCIGETRSRFEIERIDARSKQLVPCLPDVPAGALDFTKDGQRVAYVDEVNDQLWRSRADGSEKVQLTLPPLDVELPRWSPDGKWIAFMGRDPGQPWKVRLVSAEGGPYGPVTSTDASEGAPTWSPDGSRLLFGGLVNPADKTPGPLVIHIFDMKERRLSVVPGSEGLWTSRWSPDGHYIAALTEDSRNLILFDLRSGKRTRLATLGLIWDLQWSRHGESIYLDAETAKGEPALFRVKIVGHQPERLTGVMSCGWLGLAPDDSPLVARPVTSGEIYALQCQLP